MVLSCGRKIWSVLLWAVVVYAAMAMLVWTANPARGQGTAGGVAFFDRLLNPNYCKPGSNCGPQGCPAPERQPRSSKVVSRPVVPVVRPMACAVRVVVPEGGAFSNGSGVLVARTQSRAIVLTAAHSFREAVGDPIVTFPNGKSYTGKLVKIDKLWDLAAIEIDKPGDVMPIALSKQVPAIGDEIHLIGYGGDRYRSVVGRVLQYLAPGKGNTPSELIEVGKNVRHGDSGGPMVDRRGFLAGIIGGSDGRTNGPHCGRIRVFLGQILRPRKLKPPVIVRPVPQPSPHPEPQPTPSKLAVMEKQIAALMARVAELESLKSIPAGNDGVDGEDGKRGKRGLQGERGAVGKFDKTQPLFTAKFVIDGKVIRTLEVKPGGTLPLELSTTKRNRGSKRD